MGAELGVAPAIGMGGLVFQMQQLQGDVLATLVLAVDLQPVGLRPPWPIGLLAALEQSRFSRSIVQMLGERPAQASLLRAFQVVVDARPANADALSDLVVAEVLRCQAQDLADLTHAYSPSGHRASPC